MGVFVLCFPMLVVLMANKASAKLLLLEPTQMEIMSNSERRKLVSHDQLYVRNHFADFPTDILRYETRELSDEDEK